MLLDGGLGLRPKGYGPAVAVDRPAPRGALVRWLAALGGMAAAVAVVGPFVAGGGTIFLCGSAVATAGIGGALLVRLARRQTRPGRTGRKRWGIAVALGGHGVLAAALVMLCFQATLVAGLVLVAFGPSTVAGGWLLAGTAGQRLAPKAVDVRLRMAAVVLLPVAVLGLIGFFERSDPDYVGRFGTPVTAQQSGVCTVHTTWDLRWGTADSYTECPVLYTLDGDYHNADIVGADGEVIWGAKSIDAYVLDGHVETRARVGDISPTVVLGRYLPWWLLIGTLAEAVVLVVLLRRAWVEFVESDGPRTGPRPRSNVIALRRNTATRSRNRRRLRRAQLIRRHSSDLASTPLDRRT